MPHAAGDVGAIAWANGIDTAVAGKLDKSEASSTYGLLGSGTTDRALGVKLRKVGVVLSPGVAGAFDENIVESPSILADPKTGRNVMVYTGYNLAPVGSAGYAYSDDLITWTKQGQLLAGSGVVGDPDQGGITGPLLLWDQTGSQYVLYYIGMTGTGYEAGTKSLCRATATSLAGPWTRQGAVISPSGSGWRQTAIWHPSVVERAGVWYMFFNATGNDTLERIGYATATSINGPWTVDDVNSPVLNVSAGWDNSIVGDPSVRRVGNLWVMDYFGFSNAVGDGIAVTTDALFPLGWVKHPLNPILVPTVGTYDGYLAHKPFTFQRGGDVFHYYTCVDLVSGGTRQIALAMAAQGSPPSLDRLPTVTGKASDGTLLTNLLAALKTLGLPVNIGTVVASDSFERANNAALGSTEVGAKAWAVSGGAGWSVGGRQAVWSNAADGRMVINSGVYDNYALQFTMRQVNSTYAIAFIARGPNSTQGIKIHRQQGYGWGFNDDSNHTTVNIADATNIKVGDVLRCEVTGLVFKVFVNGSLRATFTGVAGFYDSAANTFQGVGGSGSTAATVDDFSVASI